MTRHAVHATRAPAALGPYSQAIVAGGVVSRRSRNLGAAGASLADVVKTTIFSADVEDFGRLNEVYARHMPDPPPARSAPAPGIHRSHQVRASRTHHRLPDNAAPHRRCPACPAGCVVAYGGFDAVVIRPRRLPRANDRVGLGETSEDAMKKLMVGVGVLLVFAGGTFGLQGLGVIGGSAMSGSDIWAVVGPLIALVGLFLVVGGLRGGAKVSADLPSRAQGDQPSGSEPTRSGS